MKAAFALAWLRLRRNPVSTAILAICLGLSLALPITGRALVANYRAQLMERSAATPLVLGARGDRFDLVLAALYFRSEGQDELRYPSFAELAADGDGVAVPIHARFTMQGEPLVGTTPEYFEQRGLTLQAGEWPLFAGEVVLGATLARKLRLQPGDTVFTDVRELYDLAVPPALKLRVVGVLAQTGEPDDAAGFVDLTTCWVLEGLAHGHDDPEEVDPAFVLGGDEQGVVVSGALLSYHEITPENLATFHEHGDASQRPLSAVLYWPRDAKDGTLVKTRFEASPSLRMSRPTEVVEELLAYVLRVRALMDLLAVVLGAVTLLLGGLVYALSARLRVAEFRTMRRIGCAPRFLTQLVVAELLMLVLLAAAIAGTASMLALANFGNVARWLGA